MRRLWPLLVLVLAIAAVLYVLRGDEAEEADLDLVERDEADAVLDPELRGLPPSQREAYLRRRADAERRRAAEAEAARAPKVVEHALVVEGRVLAAEDGKPLAKVLVWAESHQEPCPRPAVPFYSDAYDNLASDPGEGTGFDRAYTDAAGAFRLERHAMHETAEGPLDVFAFLPGRIPHATCSTALGATVDVRLEQGLSITGRVTDARGRPVARATARAIPAPETPELPGHTTPLLPTWWPRTDAEGRFEITGLLPGAVLVVVDHPHFVPATVGPLEPEEDGASTDVVLVPALRATFAIRSDDGRVPEHPTVVWTTNDVPPRQEVLLLPNPITRATAGPDVEDFGEVKGGPVRIPCDADAVVLQVKADGYATWRSEPLRLPPEGGEETYEVKLTGDLATGQLRVSLEDDRGEALSANEAGVKVGIRRLDPGATASAYVVKLQQDAHVTDLPEGRYRIRLLSARFAVVHVEAVVNAGHETHEQVRVRPPAKLHLRLVGRAEKLVPFELQRDGKKVPFVSEGVFELRRDEATGEEIAVAGPDGLTVSGLEAGTYTVVVQSEEVFAPPTVVRLLEGETEQVEIEVRPR